jgi:hypothetical protein
MKFACERYIPELQSPEINYERWHRCLFANQLVSGKIVLDVACGEGYGSFTRPLKKIGMVFKGK